MLHCLWLETVTDIKHLPRTGKCVKMSHLAHSVLIVSIPENQHGCESEAEWQHADIRWKNSRVERVLLPYTTVQLTISCYWETYILGTILPVVLSVFAAPTRTVPNEATEESKQVSEQLGPGVQFLNQRSENRLNKWFIDSVKCKLV